MVRNIRAGEGGIRTGCDVVCFLLVLRETRLIVHVTRGAGVGGDFARAIGGGGESGR